MDKELLEELLSHAIEALIESNGGSIEQALDDMGVQEERDRQEIKDWFGWDEEEEDDE